MIFIYRYTNNLNAKVYVGQTVNIETRDYQHTYHAFRLNTKSPLYSAFRKYGRDSFSLEILEECEDSIANEREIHYITHFNSTDLKVGYNLRDGGNRKSLHSTTKAKISRALVGNKNGVRANLSEQELKRKAERARKQFTGVPRSQETKDKISRALKGRKPSPEVKAKQIASLNITKQIREEEIALIVDLLNNKKHSIRQLHAITGINRPRISKILGVIEERKFLPDESGE